MDCSRLALCPAPDCETHVPYLASHCPGCDSEPSWSEIIDCWNCGERYDYLSQSNCTNCGSETRLWYLVARHIEKLPAGTELRVAKDPLPHHDAHGLEQRLRASQPAHYRLPLANDSSLHITEYDDTYGVFWIPNQHDTFRHVVATWWPMAVVVSAWALGNWIERSRQ